MKLSLIDVFIITVVSMGIVFIILLGLMYVMKLTAFLIDFFEKRAEQTVDSGETDTLLAAQPTDFDLFASDQNAKVAVVTALAIASQETHKTYKIEHVEKVGN